MEDRVVNIDTLAQLPRPAVAPTAGSLDAIHRLRYQVYCLEREFLDVRRYPDGRERDAFDEHSVHLAAIGPTGTALSTLRLVCDSPLGFPLDKYVHSLWDSFGGLPRPQVAEVSRLIVSPRHRRTNMSDPQLLFGLFRTLYEECHRRGLHHLLATMEPCLARLLRRLGFPFEPIGDTIDYFGAVTPYCAHLDTMHAGYRRILSYQRRVRRTAPSNVRFVRITPESPWSLSPMPSGVQREMVAI
jgi:N-acyl-L-homoserine lactone synthetase